jgi:hypothetical protein
MRSLAWRPGPNAFQHTHHRVCFPSPAVGVKNADVSAAATTTRRALEEEKSEEEEGEENGLSRACTMDMEAKEEMEEKGDEDEGGEESLDAFVARVCQRLGRGRDDAEAIVVKLRDNWFERPSDLYALSVEQLCAIGIPARFGQEVAVAVIENEEKAQGAWALSTDERVADAALTTAAATAAAAAAADAGWVGGDLPGPCAQLMRWGAG